MFKQQALYVCIYRGRTGFWMKNILADLSTGFLNTQVLITISVPINCTVLHQYRTECLANITGIHFRCNTNSFLELEYFSSSFTNYYFQHCRMLHYKIIAIQTRILGNVPDDALKHQFIFASENSFNNSLIFLSCLTFNKLSLQHN